MEQDRATVCSEDRAGTGGGEGFTMTGEGRIKNVRITDQILYAVVGRITCADHMKEAVKGLSHLSFTGLVSVLPTIARQTIESEGNGARLTMTLTGWDADNKRMRGVIWNIWGDADDLTPIEVQSVKGVESAQWVLGSGDEAQSLALNLMAQPDVTVPGCFPEVFAKLSAAFPEIGQGLTVNSVTRPAERSKPVIVGTANDSTYAKTITSRVISGKPLIDFSEGIHLNQNIDNMPDGTSFKRTTPNQIQFVSPTTGQITTSTMFTTQASVIPQAYSSTPFTAISYDDTLGTGAGTKVSWVSITVYNPNGTTIIIPASTDSTQKATVPTPTLSTVAGGAKALRTYFVRMAYYIDGGVRGFSSETSISVPANSLLKVTSPANTPPWTGYGIFISTTTNLEIWATTVSEGGVNVGIPFGTDWTEPTAAIASHGPQYASMSSKGLDGDMHAAAPYNFSLFFYPYWDKTNSLVRFYGDANAGSGLVAGTSSAPDSVRGMYLDGNTALAAAGLHFTTITAAQGSAGTTTGVTNTGGCPIVGTKIVPLGVSALSHKAHNSHWVEIELADGRTLTATPDHPVYTDKGKTQLRSVKVGQEVITDCGMVAVVRKEAKTFEAEKEVVSMTKGHLYHANGILSHNTKLPGL
jgi:hypothetical protein